MSMNDEIVLALLREWTARYARQDGEGLSELYCEDVLFFGSTPALAQGCEAVRAYFSALPPAASSQVAFTEVTVAGITDDVLQAAMIATFSSPGGYLPLRLTQSYVRRGGEWKIAAHHVSPLHHDYRTSVIAAPRT